jgi:hypothetical protein
MFNSTRLSPSLVVALLALLVALGGTALAASRYVVTSTKQIKPAVLQALAADAFHRSAVVHSSPVRLAPGVATPALAHCPGSAVAVSGGYDVKAGPPGGPFSAASISDIQVVDDGPFTNRTWTVVVLETPSGGPMYLESRALCVAPGGEP